MSLFTTQQEWVPIKETPSGKGDSFRGVQKFTMGAGSNRLEMNIKDGFWMGADTFATAPFSIDFLGALTASSVTIKNSAGTVLIDSDASTDFVNVINSKLNTVSQKILKDFDFGTTDYAGAVKAGDITWNTTTGAITGGSGVVVYRGGIIGANAGVATFTLDAATGNATFAGTLAAASGTLGAITVGSNAWHVDSSGNMWWGNHASYAAASIKISSAGSIDFTTGNFSGTLSAPSGTLGTITAGTIIGGTFKTATPGVGVGSSVTIVGGGNQPISLYYDATLKGTIKGYTTEGSEETYINIEAVSGRSIKLKNSRTEISGALQVSGKVYPSSDNAYELGDASNRWSKGHFEDIDVDDLYVGVSFDGCGSIAGCAYLEVNLLNEKQRNLYKENARDKEKKKDKITEFEEGDVLVWGAKGLKRADLDTCFCVAAVADKRGMPVVLGAEKIKVIGKVAINQYLVTCGVPGYARAWNVQMCGNPPIGTVIAQAMERKTTPGEGVIIAMIRKF